MPTLFNGTLNSNEIMGSIYNMIISQQVFGSPIHGAFGKLSDQFRTEGGLYGDMALFYSTDALKSYPWENDAEAANLLALDRAPEPKCQKIQLDKFRQIRLTVDNYLSKRAWGDEYAFSSFMSVMESWIQNTKRIYDATLVNSYVGTNVAEKTAENVKITLPTNDNPEVQARLRAQTIANTLADLTVDLSDVSRDYNDYGFLRSYDTNDMMIVWNSAYKNKILNIDLPTLYHQDEVKKMVAGETLPSRYFGTVNKSGGTTSGANKTIRSLVEKDFGGIHCLPGDLLPSNAQYEANETYTHDAKIICKVCHKNGVKFMSAFQTQTDFFNPRSLTETHFLTFGYADPQYLYEFPFITIKEA